MPKRQYGSNIDSVRLKCKVFLKDIVSFNDIITVKECIPISYIKNENKRDNK